MKIYYFYTLKSLQDDQGKFKMYYGMSRVKKKLSRKRSITFFGLEFVKNSCKNFSHRTLRDYFFIYKISKKMFLITTVLNINRIV